MEQSETPNPNDALSLRDLRELSDQELIRRHDALVPRVGISVNYYLQELARRDQDRQTQAMLRYTLWVAIMTGAIVAMTLTILVLTAINVWAVLR